MIDVMRLRSAARQVRLVRFSLAPVVDAIPKFNADVAGASSPSAANEIVRLRDEVHTLRERLAETEERS